VPNKRTDRNKRTWEGIKLELINVQAEVNTCGKIPNKRTGPNKVRTPLKIPCIIILACIVVNLVVVQNGTFCGYLVWRIAEFLKFGGWENF